MGLPRFVLLVAMLGWIGARAQEPQKPLPDKPEPQLVQEPKVPEPVAGDAIFAPLAVGGHAQTFKQKFESFAVVTVGPRAIVSPSFSAALKMARPPSGYPREWKDGAEAFGRNYGDEFARKFATQTGRFVVGAALHEDFRYRRDPNAKGVGRLFHAIGYTFVDSGDNGHRRLALANFAAAGAGGFVGNAYLPDGYNDPKDGLRRSSTHFISFAVNNVLREYSPEIASFFSGHHLPFPHLPIPVWYTKSLGVARP